MFQKNQSVTTELHQQHILSVHHDYLFIILILLSLSVTHFALSFPTVYLRCACLPVSFVLFSPLLLSKGGSSTGLLYRAVISSACLY